MRGTMVIFCYRCGMGLLCCHERMSDLVISHDLLFFIRKDRILLLISCDDHLDAFFQVFLCHMMPVVPHGSQCRFIDDVGQLRTGRTGCHPRNLLIVHVFIHTNFLRVNFQDILSAFQIRQFYRNSPVKAARTQQCRIQGFRTVGRGQQ